MNAAPRMDLVRLRGGGRFVELVQHKRIVKVTELELEDPSFGGAMRMTWSLVAVPSGCARSLTLTAGRSAAG